MQQNVDVSKEECISRRSFVASVCGGSLTIALPEASGAIAGSTDDVKLTGQNDIVEMTALELSFAIRSKVISCREVMEA